MDVEKHVDAQKLKFYHLQWSEKRENWKICGSLDPINMILEMSYVNLFLPFPQRDLPWDSLDEIG